jgi:hypothetical protein
MQTQVSSQSSHRARETKPPWVPSFTLVECCSARVGGIRGNIERGSQLPCQGIELVLRIIRQCQNV